MKIQQIYIPMLIRLSRGISHYFSQTAKNLGSAGSAGSTGSTGYVVC